MTIYIDYLNNICFILSPKCGTQTVSKYLQIPLNIKYSKLEINNILNDYDFKKIIVVRDVIDRFYSGFIEDLKNNDCYADLDISFYDYIKFINFCYDNKLKNVNNLKHYFKDKDKLIEWGGCSSSHLPITDSKGNLTGHIVHQEPHLKNFIELINENQDVEVIDISQLNKFTNIHENSKVYEKNDDNIYNSDTLLKDLKKATIYPKKDVMINKQIARIINHIYAYDIEFIDIIKKKFNSKKKNSENS